MAATSIRGFASVATISPSKTAEHAMPSLTCGMGTPTSPRNPSKAMTIGHVTAPSQAANFVYTKCVFEWDPRKAEANAAKHGVSFEDAVTVFLDPEALDGPDLQHSSAESRFLRLGRSRSGRVLMVAYTCRRSGDAEAIRIISARRASRRERAAYTATD